VSIPCFGVQVRCMAAVLVMVGSGAESPSVVSDLLDLSKVPAKPQYHMASETPLVLTHAGFAQYRDEVEAALRLSERGRAAVLAKLAAMTHDAEVRLGVLHALRDGVAALAPPAAAAAEPDCAPAAANAAAPAAPATICESGGSEGALRAAQPSKKQRKAEGPCVGGQPHILLLKRAVEPSFEARVAAARARGTLHTSAPTEDE
jgi:tRNA pseudouridine synthase